MKKNLTILMLSTIINVALTCAQNQKINKNTMETQFYNEYQGNIPPSAVNVDNKELGQILFSKEPIYYGQENKQKIGNIFKSGDMIYGLAYLLKTNNELNFEENGVIVSLREVEEEKRIENYSTFEWHFGYGKEPKQRDNFRQKDLDIFTDYSTAFDANYPFEFLKALVGHLKNPVYSSKVNRVFKFSVTVRNQFAQKFAIGYFSYDMRDGGIDWLDSLLSTHEEKATSNVKLVSLRNDPELAKQIKTLISKEGIEVRKVLFSVADWGIIRHEITGKILYRSIWAYVVYKDKENKLFYKDIQFVQDYIGNKFSNTIRKEGYGAKSGYILEGNF